MEAGHSGLKSPIRCKKPWKLGKVKLRFYQYTVLVPFFLKNLDLFSGESRTLTSRFVRPNCKAWKEKKSVTKPQFHDQKKGERERGFFWPVDDSAQSLPSFPYRPSPPFLFWTCWSSLGRVPCLGSQKKRALKTGGGRGQVRTAFSL